MADREPLYSKYCKEVNCQYRHGNKCGETECIHTGGEKWTAYYIEHGHLADGDVPDA